MDRTVPQALLFDLDGTLTHSDPLHFEVWRELLAERGIPLDADGYRRRISGRLNPDIVADELPQLDAAEARAFGEAKEAAFRRRATELTPLAGLPELLAGARRAGVRLALVTNAPAANARFMLDAIGLRDAFEVVVLAEELPRGKPDPGPYREALERLRVPPAAALAFEDSPTGVRAAVGAGVRTVGITTSHPDPVLREAGARLTVADFRAAALYAPGAPLAALPVPA